MVVLSCMLRVCWSDPSLNSIQGAVGGRYRADAVFGPVDSCFEHDPNGKHDPNSRTPSHNLTTTATTIMRTEYDQASNTHYYVDEEPLTASAPTEDEELKDPTGRQVGGAAVVGGIAGLLVGGPLLAAVAAGGAAAVATSSGKAGRVARKSGDVAADAGNRLKAFDKKHHVVEKTATGVSKGVNWVSDKIQRHNERNVQRKAFREGAAPP